MFGGFPDGLAVKNWPPNAESVSLIPGLGRFPGEGNGNPSGILAWEITWTEEPGRLHPMGLQRVRHELVTKQQHWVLGFFTSRNFTT